MDTSLTTLSLSPPLSWRSPSRWEVTTNPPQSWLAASSLLTLSPAVTELTVAVGGDTVAGETDTTLPPGEAPEGLTVRGRGQGRTSPCISLRVLFSPGAGGYRQYGGGGGGLLVSGEGPGRDHEGQGEGYGGGGEGQQESSQLVNTGLPGLILIEVVPK